MRVPTLKIDRREYVLVPKSQYRKWQGQPRPALVRGKTKKSPAVATELYTDQRVAEFLLTNTVNAADYARACQLVRDMGLDPAKIQHDKPVGVE
jgi:hypothetical protein